MSVLFIPDYSAGNPYQSNLTTALDADVTYGDPEARLPVLAAILGGEVAVVHLHWMNAFLTGDTRREMALEFGLFLTRLVAAKLLGIPVIWTVHNVTMHERDHSHTEYWFKRAFVRSGMCDRLIVHCEAAAAALLAELDLPEATRDRIDIIHHGHYLDNYENDCSKREAREWLGLAEGPPIFLFFGLIRRYKGVFDLIDAFQAASVPGARLVIAGKPETESLRRELRERTGSDDRICAVYEFVPDEDIQVYMNAADAVVLPFRQVTTSGSAILAMSFGQALVVPTVGCLPELLDEDGAVCYDRDREGGLRRALETAVTRDLDAMGAHNLKTVREFDWDTIADRTAETYLKAAGDSVATRNLSSCVS